MKPRNGDFVVIDSQWSYKRYEVRRVTRVTPQMYFYDEDWMGKPRSTRARVDEILFSTPDGEAAKLLSERLISSDAMKNDECRKASERCLKRKTELIEAAKATLSHLSQGRGSD